jgi:hypothetical protein
VIFCQFVSALFANLTLKGRIGIRNFANYNRQEALIAAIPLAK